jgi:NAD(P)H-dependent flavin oxidoreductase YrpB (nitropropane dioxygenase family)
MIRTRLCDLLGIEFPIISAPMGFVSGPELAAAVSNAGGLGTMSFSANPPHILRRDIERLRSLTSRPFAINLILHFPVEDHVKVCLEEKVPVLSFFWGNPAPYVEPAHQRGIKVMDQVGSVEDAIRSAKAGVDVIMAQGCEAGGHVAGEVSTLALVPRVVDAVSPIPVAAAGGIADARGVVAALALGAEAAVLGTRFIASEEALAHPLYKQRVMEATENDTVRTILFGYSWPNAPHRTLRTSFVKEWEGREAQGQESRVDEPIIGETRIGDQKVPMLRFMGFPPSLHTTGDIDSMNLLAGQSVGLVREIRPAGEIVAALMEGVRKVIEATFQNALAARI